MPIARAVTAKFKAFSFPVIKSYSVFPYSAFSNTRRTVTKLKIKAPELSTVERMHSNET